MGRDGESQPQVHATGKMLHRRIDEFLNFGEGDDLIKIAFNLGPRHAEDRPVEVNVFASC